MIVDTIVGKIVDKIVDNSVDNSVDKFVADVAVNSVFAQFAGSLPQYGAVTITHTLCLADVHTNDGLASFISRESCDCSGRS